MEKQVLSLPGTLLHTEILSHVLLTDVFLCPVLLFSFFSLCETINLEASPSESPQAWRRLHYSQSTTQMIPDVREETSVVIRWKQTE